MADTDKVMAVPRGTRGYRFLEMVPGTVLWITLIGALVSSFLWPIGVIVFMVCFSFYWLMRVMYFIVYLLVSWRQFSQGRREDWLAKLQGGDGAWENIHHLIFLPTYTESVDVLRQTLQGLRAAAYPSRKMTIVIAGEERAGKDAFLERAQIIQHEYSEDFDILITVHPKDLADEIPGKGSNLHYAGPRAVAHLEQQGIPHEQVIVSAFDVDTVVHPQYFSCLTWTFLHHPNRFRTSYQPVALYNNNMWESPSFMRVAAFGTTFWLLTELVRPDRLFTFSSHSMSLPALIDVNYWEKDIVTEDSRIFLQCFIRYHGNYTVTPLFVPVSMYTAKAASLGQSMVNLYKQQRRWAWGVEHFPYMFWHFFFGAGRRITLFKKLKYLWNLAEGMYSWATAPIILFVFSRLPLAVIEGSTSDHVAVQIAPVVLEWLLAVAMAGIIASAIASLTIVPARPESSHPASRLVMVLQWILLPITLVVFGSIPAVEAQTRLMLGKYLGFYVSKKEN
jgi:hypothetical protein